ncbi:hypothetical protein CKAH01_15457 [Colletotrichum kahawae]|uniref:Uncharacterized protein n=1 Tax=Colletotrichum kahawae TaxID=34407 RepID=A0AAD9YHB6_COLKA|nr:hypothetical protein CKAH01_15457 [Colletotrichum kahawae]
MSSLIITGLECLAISVMSAFIFLAIFAICAEFIITRLFNGTRGCLSAAAGAPKSCSASGAGYASSRTRTPV